MLSKSAFIPVHQAQTGTKQIASEANTNTIFKIKNPTDLILEIRVERILLDVVVAQIDGVEIKRINETVKNHDKFPQNCMFELSDVSNTSCI